VTGSAANYSVAPGAAAFKIPAAGSQLTAYLASVARTDADTTAIVNLDKVPTGNGLYVSVTGRRVSTNNEYRGKARFTSTGGVALSLSKVSAGVETTLRSEVVIPGLTYAAGTPISIRVQVTGSGVTTVQAKVWRADSPEPAAWAVTATDATAGLQAPGGVGLVAYLSSGSTSAPVTVKLTSFTGKPTNP
jgi:hypothetical protein